MAGATGPEDRRELGPSALKAYAHPLRLRIIRYLKDHEAATATELAKYLGESTGQTSYHLRQLAKHGLVDEIPERGTGRERWWKGVSMRFDAATLSEDPTLRPAARMILDDMVRERAASLSRWLAEVPPESWAGEATHSQITLTLAPADAAQLNTEVQAVLDRYVERSHERDAAGTQPAGAERVRVYYDLFPLLLDDEPVQAPAEDPDAEAGEPAQH